MQQAPCPQDKSHEFYDEQVLEPGPVGQPATGQVNGYRYDREREKVGECFRRGSPCLIEYRDNMKNERRSKQRVKTKRSRIDPEDRAFFGLDQRPAGYGRRFIDVPGDMSIR